jgi:anti-sigma B factor antagonist
VTVEITSTDLGGPVIVAPHGDVDLTTSPALRTFVHGLLDGGATAVVLDLSGVDFADSTVLGVLVSLRRRLGDRLVVAAPGPRVRRLFEITMFTTVLTVADSVDNAITVLKS